MPSLAAAKPAAKPSQAEAAAAAADAAEAAAKVQAAEEEKKRLDDEREARWTAAETRIQEQAREIEAIKAQLISQQRETAAISTTAQSAETLAKGATQTLEKQPKPVAASQVGLTLSGFLQVDAPFRQASEDQLNGSTGDLLNQNRFYLRRARLRLAAEHTYVSGTVELDANTVAGPAVRPVIGEVSLKWPGEAGAPPLVMATMGLFKTPFGYEIGQSDRDRLFMERSTAEQGLFPGEYDAGAKLSGGWRFLRYAVALMNGEPLGEKSFPGRDPNNDKDLVGRVGVDTGVTETIAVWAGLSVLKGHGFHKATPATKDITQWRDINNNRVVDPGEIGVATGSPPAPSFNFERGALGGDAGLNVNWRANYETVAYSEVYLAQNLDRGVLPYDPPTPQAQKVRELGWYAAVTQMIGPRVMLGVRYDLYDPDRDANEARAGRLLSRERTYASLATSAALLSKYGRLMVEFDRNRNHNGRNLSGEPVNLKDNAVIVRGQVNF